MVEEIAINKDSKMGTDCKNSRDQLVKDNEGVSTNDESLENFITAGFKMLTEATKKSNGLPQGKTRDLYESYPSFHTVVESQADYILSVLSKMMKQTNSRGSILRKDEDDKFEMIVDSNDTLLENVAISLDELSGIKRNPETQFVAKKLEAVNGSWNKSNKNLFKAANQVLNKILNQTKSIEKPQLKFKDKVNNNSEEPFEPRIKYKYNMLKPLACLLETTDNGVCQYTHPYEFELEKFKPSQEQLTHQPPILYKSLEDTPLVMVTTPEDVTKMVNDLEKYKEIAVDVEHHSYRSFQGFTCLLQISTRDTDYIIDTLPLRSDLEILNKVFTNPSIVKVFHGADLDILWLQRDLSVYVVNMFDTHQAVKLLNFPKLSLAYALSHYCNVNAQKQYQLADWRIRPLPQELITYAREDTHYLLYIYDNLRNGLIEKANNQTNLLESVISESTRICLKRYIKPIYESDGYLELYRRSKKLFDNRQKFALQKLFEWRDKTARESDESFAYVLPDHMMLNISEVLPREAQGILACCNPVPAPVRQNLLALHQMILKAREEPLIKPVLEEQRFYKHTSSSSSFDNPLLCPHDLNHEREFRDDLPVLFGRNDDEKLIKSNDSPCYCYRPIINVFESSMPPSELRLKTIAEKAVHLTPYHRYKLSKQFSESVEVKNMTKVDDNKKEDVCVSSTIKPEPNVSERNHNSEEVPEDSTAKKESNETATEKLLNSNKRHVEDEEVKKAKKLKAGISNLVVNPYALEKIKASEDSRRKKKQKKKFSQGKEKPFQPFDYKSVDFKKYKTSTVDTTKKVQRKFKQKKSSGKKNFKISI